MQNDIYDHVSKITFSSLSFTVSNVVRTIIIASTPNTLCTFRRPTYLVTQQDCHPNSDIGNQNKAATKTRIELRLIITQG